MDNIFRLRRRGGGKPYLRPRAAPMGIRGGLPLVLSFAPHNLLVWYGERSSHQGVESQCHFRSFRAFRFRLDAFVMAQPCMRKAI